MKAKSTTARTERSIMGLPQYEHLDTYTRACPVWFHLKFETGDEFGQQ
jgi:hypothetical protein